jgi:tripartite-type tricarboxylate transporter receptor subunit TctC
MLKRRSLLLAPVLAAPAVAQVAYPDRPVTMIVPYAPGGSADVMARVIAPEMSRTLGQPVVVELRPGAGGHVGGAYVARSASADGYTFLLGSVSKAVGPALQRLAYDPVNELSPLGGIGTVPMMMVVAPGSPHQSVRDVVANARARPGEVTYGSSGLGTGSHLAGELLAVATGTELLHVPYRGSGAVYPDLIAGRLTFLLDAMGSAAGQARSGAVRALGVSSIERSSVFPEVPTIAEQGVPGYEFSLWLGFFVRVGTPADVTARLEAASRAAMATTSVQERLRQTSAIAIPTDAQGFSRYFRDDVARWSALARSGQVKPIGD